MRPLLVLKPGGLSACVGDTGGMVSCWVDGGTSVANAGGEDKEGQLAAGVWDSGRRGGVARLRPAEGEWDRDAASDRSTLIWVHVLWTVVPLPVSKT